MKKRKPEELIRRLIDNHISKEELDILLDGMDDEETTTKYEAYLRNHFEKIMNEHALEKKNDKQPNK
jgi:hypothetical protein